MLTRAYSGLMRRLGLEPHERRLLLLMGALVANLLCAYTIAKVLRDALFLAEFGAAALPYAYIGVALASAGFVWLESRVARRFTRVGATRFNQYVAIGFSIAAAAAFPLAPHRTTVAFYIWTGSQAMMLLPHFWLLALDVWDSRRARRLFPMLSGCGLVGGLAGGAIAGWLTPIVQRAGLMWALPAMLLAAHALTRAIEAHRALRPKAVEVPTTASSWEIVWRSAYIKLLVVGLALSVIVSTLVDFQFKSFIQGVYPDQHALTQFLGRFYVGLNVLGLVFQFGVAGWLMHLLGLRASTILQPATVLVFASSMALSTGWLAIVSARWIQGIVFQTLGKSSDEIYYTAIHPRERRRIKPAIDTLVERWSDALVGVLLIVALHVLRVPTTVLAVLTSLLAATWLVVLFFLNRQYGRAFGQALSSRWIEPETAPESLRTPAARRAILATLRSGDERRMVLALRLCEYARSPEIAIAVRDGLRNASPSVRAAAVEAMEAMRLRDRDGLVESFLREEHQGLRRAAVSYLLARGQDPAALARRFLDGDDRALWQDVVDVLFERPSLAPGAPAPKWIDARLESGSREDLLLAARALGAMSGKAHVRHLRVLLTHPDADVRRVALASATRRPSAALLDVIVPLLTQPEFSEEAHHALAAAGNPAVPRLEVLLGDARDERAQSLAARTLAQIATPRAVDALMKLLQGADLRLRHLGLRSLARVHVVAGQPVLPRSRVHSLFLRELLEYRSCIEPARALAPNPAPEVRLLAESYGESAEMALERALQALACWYDPRPLFGVFDRLKSRDPHVTAPALDYLGHVLPRAVFRPVSRIFEETMEDDPELDPSVDRVAKWVGTAWRSKDAWLRACAVRASRGAPTFDPRVFTAAGGDDPIVLAEIRALADAAGRSPDARTGATRAASAGESTC